MTARELGPRIAIEIGSDATNFPAKNDELRVLRKCSQPLESTAAIAVLANGGPFGGARGSTFLGKNPKKDLHLPEE